MLPARRHKLSETATLRDVATTVVLLMGVWMLVQAALAFSILILTAVHSYTELLGRQGALYLGGYLLQTCVQAAVGVLLVARADWIARRLALARATPAVALPAAALRSTAFALLALYLVYDAIPGMTQLAFLLADTRASAASTFSGSAQPMLGLHVLQVAARLAFAAWLWWRGTAPGPSDHDSEGIAADADADDARS